MRALLFAAVLAVALAGCQVREPTAPGTVVNVQEARTAGIPEDLVKFEDDNLRLPEVAWQVEVRLDDGSHVTTTRTGARRYAPGERVRLLMDADGALLL